MAAVLRTRLSSRWADGTSERGPFTDNLRATRIAAWAYVIVRPVLAPMSRSSMTPGTPLPDFAAEARDLSDDLVALRRDLHRNPEIGNDLPATQARVLSALDGLPLEIATGRSLTSITAVLRGARPGPTVLPVSYTHLTLPTILLV